ncbi:MAG: 16S rRNA (guanine(527)-N(7))-methyltransferase RsmG [Thermodesulfobacteriota bacterium]
MKPEEILYEGASLLDVELSPVMVGLFMRYMSELKLWNRKINLTSLRNDRDIVIGHFLDSISAVRFVPGSGRLIDIGSGAGFPGIPLKIVRPSLEVTLLDSAHKKVMFMREVIRSLGLEGAKAVWGRAEDEGNGIARGSFDRVITRAVGPIPEILRLSESYLAHGGRIILMRGQRGREEWESAGAKVMEGFRLAERSEFTLPFGGQSRVILAVERV